MPQLLSPRRFARPLAGGSASGSVRRVGRRLLAVVAVALLAAGCTAGIATARLLKAGEDVRSAEARGAQMKAGYELRLAQRHLEEARRLALRNEHRGMVEHAREASRLAVEARRIAEGGARTVQLQDAGDDLSDAVRDRSALPEPPAEPVPADVPPALPEPPPEEDTDVDLFPDEEEEEGDLFEDAP